MIEVSEIGILLVFMAGLVFGYWLGRESSRLDGLIAKIDEIRKQRKAREG